MPGCRRCRYVDNSAIRMLTWSTNPNPANPANSDGSQGGTCWFHHQVTMNPGPSAPPNAPPGRQYSPEKGHVMGYKGPASDAPKASGGGSNYNNCKGDCDCGEGLPCGEYLWDHRNGSMLQEFLIKEFVLNSKTGLANPNVDGFYFDDGWTTKPSPVPSWASPLIPLLCLLPLSSSSSLTAWETPVPVLCYLYSGGSICSRLSVW